MRIHALRGELRAEVRGALSGTSAAAVAAVAPDSSASINEPISKPPPAATAVVMKKRRDTPLPFIGALPSRRRYPPRDESPYDYVGGTRTSRGCRVSRLQVTRSWCAVLQ